MADQEKEEKKSAKKDKKKKSKAGLLLILLILLILLGLGLNFGLGGLGGILPGGASVAPAQQSQQPTVQQEQLEPTPETKAMGAAEKTGPYVIAVGENGITLDGVAITAEDLASELGKLKEDAEVVLKDEHAVVADYSAVKEILDAAGLTYSEEK